MRQGVRQAAVARAAFGPSAPSVPPRRRPARAAQVQDKQTAALRALNDKLVRDPRISFSMVPVGDGMALCRRRE
jgi:predicted O-methyltransferase YrrM